MKTARDGDIEPWIKEAPWRFQAIGRDSKKFGGRGNFLSCFVANVRSPCWPRFHMRMATWIGSETTSIASRRGMHSTKRGKCPKLGLSPPLSYASDATRTATLFSYIVRSRPAHQHVGMQPASTASVRAWATTMETVTLGDAGMKSMKRLQCLGEFKNMPAA